jgi:hypothetical protein
MISISTAAITTPTITAVCNSENIHTSGKY